MSKNCVRPECSIPLKRVIEAWLEVKIVHLSNLAILPPPCKSDWQPAMKLLIVWLLAPSRIDLEPKSPVQLCSGASATNEWSFNLTVIATTRTTSLMTQSRSFYELSEISYSSSSGSCKESERQRTWWEGGRGEEGSCMSFKPSNNFLLFADFYYYSLQPTSNSIQLMITLYQLQLSFKLNIVNLTLAPNTSLL